MSEILKNAITFLQSKFPTALVLNDTSKFSDDKGQLIFESWPMVVLDSQSGIKQRAITIENLGSEGEIVSLSQNIPEMFKAIEEGLFVEIGNTQPKGHKINTSQMTIAPRLILYTNKLCVPIEVVMEVFSKVNTLIDVVDESEIHKTLFISYGGTDEKDVSEIDTIIRSKGVKTWFFPNDALPGEKLHRMMHDGINNFDRVLLVCSKDSLSRNGVLNEIERVLEREAKEGGSDILIPITLDDFVYSDWAPERKDIADQVRTRVIAKIEVADSGLIKQVNKIVKALLK